MYLREETCTIAASVTDYKSLDASNKIEGGEKREKSVFKKLDGGLAPICFKSLASYRF